MPMHPRPIAETIGPFAPSFRCFIAGKTTLQFATDRPYDQTDRAHRARCSDRRHRARAYVYAGGDRVRRATVPVELRRVPWPERGHGSRYRSLARTVPAWHERR